ncbi:MAG: GNAT family N-acetyltransferase [Candidatus Bipolaricaulis sp.]|nr:GNAT family N-acetyltransferase [Candidatus Bipolaricaulis sp.]
MTKPPSRASSGWADVTFRLFREDADYVRMQRIALESSRADHDDWVPTLDEIRTWCAPTARFDPAKQLVFASVTDESGVPVDVGVTRVSWYTARDQARVYPQASFLLPEWRIPGIWPALVREGDRRIRAMAAGHPSRRERYFQGWAAERQEEWIGALKAEGYEVVRHFRNMVRPLESVPEAEGTRLPPGLEVRPVQAVDMRKVWEAQAEVNRELFEYVAEQWAEERYPDWLADTSHAPHLWQVAWDGDQLAGMVLPRIDEEANRGRERKRGYTEHVFVRRSWRGRGLAKALLTRSLRVLTQQGMDEAELGVDSENESGAYGFYERMGYVTETTDIWFRKPLGANRRESG